MAQNLFVCGSVAFDADVDKYDGYRRKCLGRDENVVFVLIT